MIENNGPADEAAEFDRLMALEGSETETEVTEKEADEAPPAPVAADTTVAEVTGDQGAPVGGGEGGGTNAEPTGATDIPQDDWVTTLPQEVQDRIKAERETREQELQAERDRYKALHGRVAPVQQALNDAQRRLNERQQVVQPAQPAAPTQGVDQTLDSYFDSPGWKQWEADFPGDAKVLRSGLEAQQRVNQTALSRLEEQVQGLTQRLGQTEQVASRTVANDELSKLESVHSDWRAINESDEFWNDYFESWRAKQPKSIRDQFYDPDKLNVLFNDSEFVIARLDEYKAQRQSVAPPAVVDQVPPPESTQPAQPPAPSARLAMSVAPDVRGGSPVPQVVSLDTLTPGEQFDHVWQTTD